MPSWIDPVLLQLVFTLLPMKPPARAEFSTPNIDDRAALAGLGTVDGITLVEGDPILLTGQTDGTQNGVWLVSAGAWTKRADGTLLGSMTVVLQGSSAGQMWLLSNATEPVIGLDVLNYVQLTDRPSIVLYSDGDPALLLATGHYYIIDTSGAPVADLTMPAHPIDGHSLVVKDGRGAAAGNHIHVLANSGQQIEDYNAPGTFGGSSVLQFNGIFARWVWVDSYAQWMLV